VSPANAFAAEAVGTAFLLFFVFALTDRRNPNAPSGRSNLYAYFIGFTVAIIISIVAPLTQAGLNPARDFAPRIVAYFAGWGRIAIPGPRGSEWWLYMVAPIVGGLVGAFAYDLLVRRFLPVREIAPEAHVA
jgi:glycerol uptake facilitator protein